MAANGSESDDSDSSSDSLFIVKSEPNSNSVRVRWYSRRTLLQLSKSDKVACPASFKPLIEWYGEYEGPPANSASSSSTVNAASSNARQQQHPRGGNHRERGEHPRHQQQQHQHHHDREHSHRDAPDSTSAATSGGTGAMGDFRLAGQRPPATLTGRSHTEETAGSWRSNREHTHTHSDRNDRRVRGQPAWMDEAAPAEGSGSLPTRRLPRNRDSNTASATASSAEPTPSWATATSPSPLESTTGPKEKHVDSIQAWKAEMRELERKKKLQAEKELRREMGLPDLSDADLQRKIDIKEGRLPPTAEQSTPSAAAAPAPASAPKKSVFADFLLPSASAAGAGSNKASSASASASLDTSSSAPGDPAIISDSSKPASKPEEGSKPRSSRFARFFDAQGNQTSSPPTSKSPDPPQPQSQGQSLLAALLPGAGAGANTNSSTSPAPSQADAQSMMRLMEMLHMSSSSPAAAAARNSAPQQQQAHAQAVSPQPPAHQQAHTSMYPTHQQQQQLPRMTSPSGTQQPAQGRFPTSPSQDSLYANHQQQQQSSRLANRLSSGSAAALHHQQASPGGLLPPQVGLSSGSGSRRDFAAASVSPQQRAQVRSPAAPGVDNIAAQTAAAFLAQQGLSYARSPQPHAQSYAQPSPAQQQAYTSPAQQPLPPKQPSSAYSPGPAGMDPAILSQHRQYEQQRQQEQFRLLQLQQQYSSPPPPTTAPAQQQQYTNQASNALAQFLASQQGHQRPASHPLPPPASQQQQYPGYPNHHQQQQYIHPQQPQQQQQQYPPPQISQAQNDLMALLGIKR